MKLIISILLLITTSIFGQDSIQGEFDTKSGLFQQTSFDYWIGEYKGDYAKYSKNGYYGIIDKEGTVILPMRFDEILITDTAFYANLRNKHHVYSVKGELIKEPTYDWIIKKQGVVYSDLLQSYQTIERTKYLGTQVFNHKNVLYNYDGKFIIDLPNNAQIYFNEGISAINNGKNKDKKYGYINQKGKTILPMEFDRCSRFQNGRGIVTSGNKSAAINNKGDIVIPFTKSIVPFSHYSFGLCRYLDLSSYTYGYIDTLGDLKIAPKYSKAGNFSSGFAEVYHNGKRIYIDELGQEFTKRPEPFVDGHRLNTSGGKTVYEDKNGKPIFDFKYGISSSSIYFKDGLAMVSANGKKGAIDHLGQEVIPLVYDLIKISNGHVIVADSNEFWIVDKNNNKIVLISDYVDQRAKDIKNFHIPFEFNFNGYLKTRISNMVGLIDSDCRQILPNEFEDLKVGEYWVEAKKGLETGVFNLRGELVIPFENQRIVSRSKNGLIVRKGNEVLVFDNAFNLKFYIESLDSMDPEKHFTKISGIYAYKSSKTGLFGFIDMANMSNSDPKYDLIKLFAETRLLQIKKGRVNEVYISHTKDFQKINFDILKEVNSKILIVKKEDGDIGHSDGYSDSQHGFLYGLMNQNAEIIQPLEYNLIKEVRFIKTKSIDIPSQAILFALKNGIHYFIDQNGELIQNTED